MVDSGRHTALRRREDDDRYQSINDRLGYLEEWCRKRDAMEKHLIQVIEHHQTLMFGANIVRWFAVVGAACVAIWAAVRGVGR
jgi:hypothetical protein